MIELHNRDVPIYFDVYLTYSLHSQDNNNSQTNRFKAVELGRRSRTFSSKRK